LRNRFVTAFGIAGTIDADVGDGLISGNLVEQTRQHRRIAGGVVGYFDSPDFQRGRGPDDGHWLYRNSSLDGTV